MRPRMGLVLRFCSKNGHTLHGVLNQAVSAGCWVLGAGPRRGLRGRAPRRGLAGSGFKAVLRAVQPGHSPRAGCERRGHSSAQAGFQLSSGWDWQGLCLSCCLIQREGQLLHSDSPRSRPLSQLQGWEEIRAPLPWKGLRQEVGVEQAWRAGPHHSRQPPPRKRAGQGKASLGQSSTAPCGPGGQC